MGEAGFTDKTTPKQAFGEFRPGFEGVTLYSTNMDTYASPIGVLRTNRRNSKLNGRVTMCFC